VDVVIFQVADHLYAVNADAVREVIEPVPVTPLPFVSREVEGLINVSGKVVLQICVSLCLGRGEMATPVEGVVMLLASTHGNCACRVLRVIARVAVDDATISYTSSAEGGDLLLCGEFLWNAALVLLLDPARLMREQNREMPTNEDETGLVAERYGSDLYSGSKAHGDLFPCLLFSCNSELFAFRFDDVAEVVERGEITPMPGAPPEMPGVMLLRGSPLPLFSMQAILFGKVEESAPFIVVVNLNGYRAGILVERVFGFQRFSKESLRPLAEEQTLLEGIITAEGHRMVALIRFAALTAPERFALWCPWLIAGAVTAEGEARGERSTTMLRLLLFRIGRELLALPLDMVERIEEYSEPTATPGDEGGGVSGVIQIQGNVMPVRNLAKLAGIVSTAPSSVYLIVSNSGNRCALPVEKVERVVDIDEADIEPAGSGQSGILNGICKYHGKLVSLLDGERLAV